MMDNHNTEGVPPPQKSSGISPGCIIALVVTLAVIVPIGCCGGVLMWLVSARFATVSTNAHSQAAKAHINMLETQLEVYRLDVGEYPTTEQGLDALHEAPLTLEDPDKWLGPYAEAEIPLDPWDNPYQYELLDPDSIRICSFGPDGEDGTPDDVANQ